MTHDDPRYVKLNDVLEVVKALPLTLPDDYPFPEYRGALTWPSRYREDVIAAIEALLDAECDAESLRQHFEKALAESVEFHRGDPFWDGWRVGYDVAANEAVQMLGGQWESEWREHVYPTDSGEAS